MPDVHSAEVRSANMSSIRGKNTRPEWVLRSALHHRAYRYRVHASRLPGRPDLVFPGRKKVIFVNGCFWHMHECRYGAVIPKTNAEFWQTKRTATVARDARKNAELENLGWKVLTVWECQLRKDGDGIERAVGFLES